MDMMPLTVRNTAAPRPIGQPRSWPLNKRRPAFRPALAPLTQPKSFAFWLLNS